MPTELRRTALTDRHRELGARLVDFAGWEMPLEFAGVLAEHRAVRSGVGVFDVSHLGTVRITGPEAIGTVAASFTNDPRRLADGSSQYTLCCDDDGGILDDLIVYRLAAERWLAVPNAANTGVVVARLAATAPAGTTVEDASAEHAMLAVQGPAAPETVATATGVDLRAIPYLGVAEVEMDGRGVLVCRTGYTGEPGCELVVPDAGAVALFDRLLAAGAVPAGLGARDTLRLEMGYPLHGSDLGPSTDPYEARLGWAVKLDHGPFPGRDALRARAGRPPARRLLGLRGRSRRPPRAGMTVHREGREVGSVTSGSFSPELGAGIGLAFLRDPVAPGDEVSVDVRGRPVPFTVVRPPFVERDPRG